MLHLSIFPNKNCVVCSKPVKNNALHCKKCEKKWLETKEKEKK